MLNRFLRLVFLVTLVVGTVCAQTESDAYLKSLRPRGYVNDFADVLSSTDEQELDSLLQDLNRKTGAALTVVAVDSMRGGEVNDFANRLFEQWGIGKKGRDNGILLFASIKNRKARIEVGYGLEALLPDAQTGRILDQAVIPWFKQEQYGKGLMNGTLSIARRVADDAGVTLGGNAVSRTPGHGTSRERQRLSWFHILLLILLIPVIIRHPWLLLLLLSGGRGGGFSGGGFGGGAGGFGGGLSGGGGGSRGW